MPQVGVLRGPKYVMKRRLTGENHVGNVTGTFKGVLERLIREGILVYVGLVT